jgi:hypothetical protein
MERLVEVARLLREEHEFHGYIHLKTIPEASPELIAAAGRYADRPSVNQVAQPEVDAHDGLEAQQVKVRLLNAEAQKAKGQPEGWPMTAPLGAWHRHLGGPRFPKDLTGIFQP